MLSSKSKAFETDFAYVGFEQMNYLFERIFNCDDVWRNTCQVSALLVFDYHSAIKYLF